MMILLLPFLIQLTLIHCRTSVLRTWLLLVLLLHPLMVSLCSYFRCCLDALTKEGNMSNISGSEVNPDNILTFPVLNTLGISMTRVNFAPGGYNPPHSHPRATEAGIILKGKVLVGLVTTRNKYYSKVLSPWQMFVIHRGLVHLQLNVGKGKALAITTFNSQFPGSLPLPKTIFVIPEQFLTRTFKVEADVIETIRSKLGG